MTNNTNHALNRTKLHRRNRPQNEKQTTLHTEAEVVGAGESGVGDYPTTKSHIPVGGRLLHFSHHWNLVTSDTWVLETVHSGYRLEFTNPPLSESSATALKEEVQNLLDKQAVEEVHMTQVSFLSPFFLTTKKSGEWRPILNLRALNRHMKPSRFRIESLAAVLLELKKGWWGINLDLKDAYLLVPVHPSDRRWLGFSIGVKTYRFKTLPFGLSTAPRTFTRVAKVIAEHLRKKGVFIFVYLDDWLVTAPSSEILASQTKEICTLLERLGFIIITPASISNNPVFGRQPLISETGKSHPQQKESR